MPPYEITIGMNGRIWIKTSSVKDTIFLYESIKNYSYVDEEQTETYIKTITDKDD